MFKSKFRHIVLGLGITREDGKSNAKDYRKYSIPTGGHGNFIPMNWRGNFIPLQKWKILIPTQWYKNVNIWKSWYKVFIDNPRQTLLIFVVTCKPYNGFTNCFFSWKLRSIRKFWIQDQFCMILGSQDIRKTKWDFCDRSMW